MTASPLGHPVQIAYAVTDVGVAAARFAAATGAGPFFVAPHVPLREARVHGRPGAFDHSSAYGQWGTLMVELVEEHTLPLVGPLAGPLVDPRFEQRASALHHMAFMVPSLADAAEWCAGLGWPEILWATTTGGQEFAFCDARATWGHLVELYEPSDRLRGFYAMVAEAATGWTGTDPVRWLG